MDSLFRYLNTKTNKLLCYLGLKQRLATEEKLLEEEQENDVEMVATEDENNIDHSKLSYIKI